MSKIEDGGPTVYEAAKNLLVSLDVKIASLQEQRLAALRRMKEFSDSTMLEAERLATKAEPMQRHQLPEPRP